MKTFEVVFTDESRIEVNGTRIYSDNEFYYIDNHEQVELGAWYHDKYKVKSISPIEEK